MCQALQALFYVTTDSTIFSLDLGAYAISSALTKQTTAPRPRGFLSKPAKTASPVSLPEFRHYS